MDAIGVIFNEADQAAVARARELEALRQDVVSVPSLAPARMPPIKLLIVLGGDGTFLRGAHLVAPLGTPILGVDMGTLGFLAEVAPAAINEAIGRFEQGQYACEERVMLEVEARRLGSLISSSNGLNDGVVARGHSGRMIEFSVEADGNPIATYAADGFIVATPTGSTAYALAAGGPVLSPEVAAFMLVPICPHSLTARALVISDDRRIRILVQARSETATLSVDGVSMADELLAGDEVLIRRAPFRARLVKLGADDFFRRLRYKLQWGGRGGNV